MFLPQLNTYNKIDLHLISQKVHILENNAFFENNGFRKQFFDTASHMIYFNWLNFDGFSLIFRHLLASSVDLHCGRCVSISCVTFLLNNLRIFDTKLTLNSENEMWNICQKSVHYFFCIRYKGLPKWLKGSKRLESENVDTLIPSFCIKKYHRNKLRIYKLQTDTVCINLFILTFL